MSPFTRALSLLVIGMFSVQFGAALSKKLYPFVGAQGATTYRTFFAALILAFLFKPWTLSFHRRQWGIVLLYGSSLGFMNLFFYMALNTIPLGICVAMEFIGPLCVTVYYSRRWQDFLWLFLAVSGFILILPISKLAAPLDPLGVMYALLAGSFWGLYIVFGRKAGKNGHSGKIAAFGVTVAATVAFPFGLSYAGANLFDLSLIGFGLGVAILSSAIPYTLEMVALQNIPPQTFGILISLGPAIAALSGFLFLNETLTLLQWLAILLVILASLGSAVTSPRLAPETTES